MPDLRSLPRQFVSRGHPGVFKRLDSRIRGNDVLMRFDDKNIDYISRTFDNPPKKSNNTTSLSFRLACTQRLRVHSASAGRPESFFSLCNVEKRLQTNGVTTFYEIVKSNARGYGHSRRFYREYGVSGCAQYLVYREEAGLFSQKTPGGLLPRGLLLLPHSTTAKLV